jgi:methionyl-tRNA formyltransferase
VKVAIITPAQPVHHQHFCAHLARRHDVVGIVHPRARAHGRGGQLKRMRREVKDYGAGHALIRALASVPGPLRGWDAAAARGPALRAVFNGAAAEYDELAAPIARSVDDVNGPEAVEYLRGLGADVVVCLGGPIYRKPLIEAAPLMINFHSGISPLYNGTSTIAFAFANGHPHLCGGTLMLMSRTVDGGDILAHYLPAIEAGDDPATLFAKTVAGAAQATDAFLTHLEGRARFVSCPQPPPLFYYRGADWTIDHGQRVRRALEGGIAEEHLRDERLEPYWDAHDEDDARRRINHVLAGLMQLS